MANGAGDTLRLAVIPGDGIGGEVTACALEVLGAAAELAGGPAIETTSFPWGCDYFHEHGRMVADDALEQLARFDAILFGAVGFPGVPDHVSLWGLRLAVCQGFDQGVNVRPVKLLPGVDSPLAGRGADEIDFVVVRENSEGEYAGVGGRSHRGTPAELAIQSAVYTRAAIERVGRYAFALAARRPAQHLISVTKSNAMQHASVLWDEVMAELAPAYPDVRFESELVDATAARLVLRPESADVLVASNLHADILSDLTAALAGSLGVAPSANLHVDGRYPSMFEPVHGSAPDIAGKGIANPVGTVLSAAMMAEELGHPAVGEALRRAVRATCAAGVKTPDLGGTATSAEVTAAMVEALRAPDADPAAAAAARSAA